MPIESHPYPRDIDGCDPLIYRLKCKPAGIAAQAASNATNQPPLAAAHETYDAVRLGYRDARQLVAHDVSDLRHEIKSLVERIRCKFKQDYVPAQLDHAHAAITAKLNRCAPDPGELHCEFDTDTDELGDDEVELRTKQYEDDLTAAQNRFQDLAGEADALKKRVTAGQAELAKVNVEYSGDPATTDIKQVYVHALVTRDQFKKLWNGFDSYTDYADQLQAALICWTRAADAVATMAMHKAIRECRGEEEARWCANLAANTVKEILARYERETGAAESEEQEREVLADAVDDAADVVEHAIADADAETE